MGGKNDYRAVLEAKKARELAFLFTIENIRHASLYTREHVFVLEYVK